MQKILSIIIFVFSTSALGLDLPDKRQEFISPDEAFVMSVSEINNNQMLINWEIEKGYYLYMGMFEFSTDQDEVKIIEATMPDGTRKVDEFFGDVDVFYNKTNVKLVFNKIIEGTNLIVKYQGCADAGLCYPPIKKVISLDRYSSKEGGFLKTSSSNSQYSITQQLIDQSILFNIFLFLLAGLLLSFTPCVFPMIPILTGIIVGQGPNISTRKSFLLSLTYVVSMATTYAIAGTIIASSGINIQASLQNPYMIGGFAALFILLALSMFNFITIQMPQYFQNILINKSNTNKSGTYIGVGIMGSLSALIVGPCVTAPLIGALVYIASTNNYIIGATALFSLGIGMGLPLLVLGTSASELMKKIGPYLEIVNKIFGVLFLVVAVWLVERILSINTSAFLWAILALFVSWIFYRSNIQGMIIKSTLNVLSIILVCYSLLQFYGLSINDDFDPSTSFIEKESIVVFTKLDNTSEVFQSISNAKNITMLDLWADWCVACKELDKYTFSDDRVEKLLKKMNIIKFDITYNNDDHAKFMNNYKIYGPPALMFFNNDGEEIESARIVGFIDADKFIIELKNLGIN
jgi:thiol:disulfide interchange protein DsbD